MRTMKRRAALLLTVAAMFVLSACGMKEEDAALYTKSVMDASYKGEFEEYMKQTKSTEQEAKELYEGNMDMTMEQAGFDQLQISEELAANYKQLFMDMGKLADYKVGEAKKGDNKEFIVDITVKSFTGFDGIQGEVTNVLTQDMISSGNVPSEAELTEMLFQKMYELMAERLKNPTYGDEQVLTVTMKPNADNVYSISDTDMTTVDNALFPSDNF